MGGFRPRLELQNNVKGVNDAWFTLILSWDVFAFSGGLPGM